LDTVVDGVTGLLVPPRDPAAIAAAVERLLASPDLRRAMGRQARDRVEAHYTWESAALLTEEAYATAYAAAAHAPPLPGSPPDPPASTPTPTTTLEGNTR